MPYYCKARPSCAQEDSVLSVRGAKSSSLYGAVFLRLEAPLYQGNGAIPITRHGGYKSRVYMAEFLFACRKFQTLRMRGQTPSLITADPSSTLHAGPAIQGRLMDESASGDTPYRLAPAFQFCVYFRIEPFICFIIWT